MLEFSSKQEQCDKLYLASLVHHIGYYGILRCFYSFCVLFGAWQHKSLLFSSGILQNVLFCGPQKTETAWGKKMINTPPLTHWISVTVWTLIIKQRWTWLNHKDRFKTARLLSYFLSPSLTIPLISVHKMQHGSFLTASYSITLHTHLEQWSFAATTKTTTDRVSELRNERLN